MVDVGYPPDTNFEQVSKDDIKEFGQFIVSKETREH